MMIHVGDGLMGFLDVLVMRPRHKIVWHRFDILKWKGQMA